MGTVDAISIALTWTDAGNESVPYVAKPTRQREPRYLLLTVRIEEAEFDPFCIRGKQGEIASGGMNGRPQR